MDEFSLMVELIDCLLAALIDGWIDNAPTPTYVLGNLTFKCASGWLMPP